MSRRTFPHVRHDGSDWISTDGVARRNRAGADMSARCCLVYLNCDWLEIAVSLGLPSWADGLRPCYQCNSDKESLCNVELVSAHSSGPFRENTEDDYYTACQRCEHTFEITREQHADIVQHLVYDKRDNGFRGLALRNSIPSVPGLVAGVRIEPSSHLRNAAN